MTATSGLERRIELLRSHYLFADVGEEILQSLARMSREQELEKDEVLFFRGEEGDALYGVLSGSIRATVVNEEGKEYVLALMEEGDVFGEIALLDGLPRTTDCRATTKATVMVVPRDPFMKFLGETPELMLHVIEMLCERLRNTTESVTDIIFLDLRARLAKRLVALAVGYGRETEDGIRIALKLSQSDLGRLLGATREAVNKQLHGMIEERLIALDGRTIVVCDLQRLRRISGEIGHTTPPPIEE